MPAYTNNVDYIESLLYFGASGILLHAAQTAYYDQLPIKSLGTNSLLDFPGQEHYRYIGAFSLLRKESTVCDPLTGEKQHKQA